MGSSHREQAALALLGLAGHGADCHANVVAADEPSRGAYATRSLPGWVTLPPPLGTLDLGSLSRV